MFLSQDCEGKESVLELVTACPSSGVLDDREGFSSEAEPGIVPDDIIRVFLGDMVEFLGRETRRHATRS